MLTRCRLLLLLVASVVFAGQAAFATTVHPNVNGLTVNFTGIQETTTSPGDPEPIWGAPSGLGDQLIFTPAATYQATTTGGGLDTTDSQLQLVIQTSALGATIQQVFIDEVGTNSLTGTGTLATGTFAGMSGFLTITDTLSGPIAPVVIGFNAGGGVNGSFTPAALGSLGLFLPTDSGVTAWSANVSIDVASIVPNATRAVLSLDNNLLAASEAGSTATLAKTGVTITVIPEPGTAALLGVGLLVLGLRRNGRRA
jgi:hypothetical protein